MGPLLSGGFASDGFMLNLGSMLLRFCNPFTEKPEKLNKVGSVGTKSNLTKNNQIFISEFFAFFGHFTLF